MKICIVHRYPLSIIEGTNPSLPCFLNKLIDRDHQVYLVTYKNDKKYQFKGKIHFADINVTFKRENPFELLIKSFLFVFIVPLKVLSLDKRVDFDLIYCDDSFPLYELFIKLLLTKKVLIRRGDLMCAYILDKFGILGKLLFKIAFAIERYTWKRVDGISVITEKFKRYLKEHDIEEKKVFVIEDSIDFKKFKNNQTELSAVKSKLGLSDEFIVMFHGLIMKMKGVDTLIKAIPLVVSKHKSVKFLIIGEGEDFQSLKELANQLGITEHIIFTGWVPYNDIQTYLEISDIGVPLRKNTLANSLIVTTALLQYWAASKPVIVPRLDAIEDIVKEGENGFIYKPQDHRSLAAKIIMSIDQRNYLLKMGENGRNFAAKKYNADIIAEKMCKFLQNFSGEKNKEE